MSRKEYIVSLNRNVNYDEFWADMESNTDGLLYVPDRDIEIVNVREGSLRSCHYSLTDEEAATLRNDPRVYSVEIPPDQRTDIKIGLNARQSGNFLKTSSSSGALDNWGLLRCNSTTNIFGTNSSVDSDYLYNLSGEDVDIVIQDSGIQVDHPEFITEDGDSRVQLIDWYAAAGITGTQSPDHYRDWDGHGTHVAGTAAGKTFGWAKNASIFSQKLSGLEGTGDSGNGISINDAFDLIKLWHQRKPVNKKTGYKRPTVVNMSWGYSTFYNTVSSMTYRGVEFTGALIDSSEERAALGLLPLSGLPAANFRCNIRVPSVDVDIQEMIDAGIHVIIAAGNSSHKIDVELGLDFANTATTDTGTKEYHQGSSPFDDQAIKVGSLASSPASSTLDQRASYSETGPGVDIWAPGTDIISCTSNTVDTNRFSPTDYAEYYLDPEYLQMNISGTSMAAPQVAGVAALVLSANPGLTPAVLKSFLVLNSGSAIFTTGVDNDYTNIQTLAGGAQRVLFNKFNQDVALRHSGGIIKR